MTGVDGVPPEIFVAARAARLGEVIGSWHAPRLRLRSEATFVCAGGVVLGAASGRRVIASGGWDDVASFRWAKMMYNVHDSGIGRVNTWTSFTVRIGLAGRTVKVGFRSATAATWDRDFFMYGADLPDLRDERTLYRIEDEITRCWLPRFRARLTAGQSAEFGAVALSSEGVRHRRRVFPWQRVAGAEYKVRNPGTGEKKPGSGTRLHLYVREPGRSDSDGMAWPEVVIPSLEIDYMDVLIKLINEQPTSARAGSAS